MGIMKRQEAVNSRDIFRILTYYLKRRPRSVVPHLCCTAPLRNLCHKDRRTQTQVFEHEQISPNLRYTLWLEPYRKTTTIISILW